MKISRKRAALRNGGAALLTQGFSYLLAFLGRTVFLQVFSVEFLGISSLFSDILSLISLLELGIGSGISYFLFRALAMGDRDLAGGTVRYAARLLRYVGMATGLIGAAILPFLGSMTQNAAEEPYLITIYLLFLLEPVVLYWFSSYRILLTADQSGALVSLTDGLFLLLCKGIQIAVLLLVRDFILYLMIQNLSSLLSHLAIRRIAKRRYPYLAEAAPLPHSERQGLRKQVRFLFGIRAGYALIHNTDTLLLTRFAGLEAVGIYAGYRMLIELVSNLFSRVFTALMPSIGSYMQSEEERRETFIYPFFLLTALCFGISSVCFFVLLNPFIRLWLGTDYLLKEPTVLWIVSVFYVSGMRQVFRTLMNTLGLFREFRLLPYLEVGVKLTISILLGSFMGLDGILLGTLTASLCMGIWMEPAIVLKRYFGISRRRYYRLYLCYGGVFILETVLLRLLRQFRPLPGLIGFLLEGVLTFVLAAGIFLLLVCRTETFRRLVRLIRK